MRWWTTKRKCSLSRPSLRMLFCVSAVKVKKIFWRTDVKYFDFFIHSVNSHLQWKRKFYRYYGSTLIFTPWTLCECYEYKSKKFIFQLCNQNIFQTRFYQWKYFNPLEILLLRSGQNRVLTLCVLISSSVSCDWFSIWRHSHQGFNLH